MNIMNHVNLCCGTQGMAKTLAPNFTQGSGFMSRCTIPKFRMSSSPISASSKRASAAWKSWNVMNMGWPETRSTITSPHPCHRARKPRYSSDSSRWHPSTPMDAPCSAPALRHQFDGNDSEWSALRMRRHAETFKNIQRPQFSTSLI